MSSFTGSFGDDGGYDSRLPPQRVDSQRSDLSSNFVDNESVKEAAEDDILASQPTVGTPSPTSIFSDGDGLSSFSPERSANGPILPPPTDMDPEEGFALREWRRQNAIRLEQKEKDEKEMLKEILDEADEYKADFHRKWRLRCENNKAANREKELLFQSSREKFHAETSKNYWKAIGELIPNEVPTIEKKGKKDKEKKPSIVVIQGPKPGKPTDLSRMRQILVKLKHNPPPHINPPNPPSSEPRNDPKNRMSSPASGAPAIPATVARTEALAAS